MPLRSRICELLNIEYPIVLAGMGGASVPALAAAVSNAGGLGVLGAAACAPERLRAWIRQTRELTDKPFGVDTLLPASVRRGSKQGSGAAPEDPMALIAEYRACIDELLAGLNADNLALAVEIARIPEEIRGYGHVKERHLKAARPKWDGLMAQWRGSPAALAQRHAA